MCKCRYCSAGADLTPAAATSWGHGNRRARGEPVLSAGDSWEQPVQHARVRLPGLCLCESEMTYTTHTHTHTSLYFYLCGDFHRRSVLTRFFSKL